MNRKYQLPNSWEDKIETIKIKGAKPFDKIQNSKQEAYESWADHAGYNNASRYKKKQARSDNVIRVLSFPEVSPSGKQEMIKEFDFSHNLVTDNGEIYYAKLGAGEAAATNEDFGGTGAGTGFFDMGTVGYAENETDVYTQYSAGASSISGSIVTFTGGYPKTNDTGDADNTGDAVDAVSYAINYSAASWADTTVEQGCIHDNASPIGATKLLAVFSFTLFAKTASDTLKVFVNHAFENQP